MRPERIYTLVRRTLGTRLVRVAAIGGVGVVVQTLIFESIGVYLGLVSPSLATVVGGEAGVLVAFTLNNRYAFGDRVASGLVTRLARYHLIVAGSLAIQWATVYTAEHANAGLLVIHAAYAAGIILGFIWNYTWYTLWVWRHHETTQVP